MYVRYSEESIAHKSLKYFCRRNHDFRIFDDTFFIFYFLFIPYLFFICLDDVVTVRISIPE